MIASQQEGSGYTASPIATVNEQDAVEFFTQFAAVNSQGYLEPHADWNNLMYSPAQDILGLVNALAGQSPFYPGDVLSLVFENQTTLADLQWLAVFNDPSFQINITSAQDFYNNFVVNDYSGPSFKVRRDSFAEESQLGKRQSPTTTTQTSTSSATPTTWSNPAYPSASLFISQPDLGSSGVLTGYFIDTSIGVLSIPSFQQTSDSVESFSATVGKFLQQSQQNGVKTIVVDLQSNLGGLPLLAFGTFKQVSFRRNM